MTLKELYTAVGGNYDEVLSRLRTEDRIIKFITLFLKDTSFADLSQALKEKNQPEAFRAAHTLKGISANLGLGALHRSSHGLTELLRQPSVHQETDELFALVEKDYHHTADAIRDTLQHK